MIRNKKRKAVSGQWETAVKADFPVLLDFLHPREHTCVSLTSRLNRKGRAVWPGGQAEMVFHSAGGHVDGLVYINVYGLALPVLDPDSLTRESFRQLANLLRNRLRKIHTIIGTGESVKFLEKMVPGKKHGIDYFLMVRRDIKARTSSGGDSGAPSLSIFRAGPKHAELLFPLQEGYEKEEVLIRPDTFHRERSMKLFKLALEEHLVYYGSVEDVPVTKAGTNAIGFYWAQMGGVFTEPSFRGRGYAEQVVAEVCRELERRNKKTCLFVKKENVQALSLYVKTGFEPSGSYRIAYFH